MAERERSDSISSAGSIGSIGEINKNRGRGEWALFRKSRKMQRSPKEGRQERGEGEGMENWKKIMERMMMG